MLTALLDGWFKLDLGEGAFYAVFGFLFVFVGIALIIAVFSLLGLIMKRAGGRKEKQEEERQSAVEGPLPPADTIPPETVAAITAAIAAYMQESPQKCDFVVRRIKRL